MGQSDGAAGTCGPEWVELLVPVVKSGRSYRCMWSRLIGVTDTH